MKKELSVYVLSLLMLTGCSSVPLTGRKQLFQTRKCVLPA